MASSIVEKKTRGQQKIIMEKIKNDKNLSVTFSKRRSGLFTKAGALSTMCGAEVALIVFSPGSRAFCFGHPNVDAIVHRYLSGSEAAPPQPASTSTSTSMQNEDVVRDLHAQLRRVMEQVEAEKKRAEELRRKRKELEAKCWMAAPFHTLSRPQLLQVKARLLEMSQELTRHDDRVPIHDAFTANPAHEFYAGGSSSDPVALPDQQISSPLPMAMPQMPPVIDQNPVFGGNTMAPPYDGCDSLGVCGGPARFY